MHIYQERINVFSSVIAPGHYPLLHQIKYFSGKHSIKYKHLITTNQSLHPINTGPLLCT